MDLLPKTSPLVLVLALAACGGATPPPNDASKTTEGAAAPGSGSSALATERQSFITECKDNQDLEDFCACSWETLVKTTTAEERKDVENPNTKKALASLPQQCGSKLPKASLKETFMKSCATAANMVPFCECSFKFLDSKNLLTGSEEELAKAEGDMKASCSGELYIVAKDAFVGACQESQKAATCQCTFSALEKKFGKEKLLGLLASGSDEAKKAAKAAAASCGAQ